MLLKVSFSILAELEDGMLLPQSELGRITEVLASEKAWTVRCDLIMMEGEQYMKK